MKRIISLITVAISISMCLCACGGTAYSKPIEAAIQMTYFGNKDYIEYAVPEEYFEWYEDRYDEDFDDYCDEWDDEQWIDEFGEDYDVTYEISNEEKVDKDTVDDIADALEDKFDIDSSDVKKAYKFDIEYFIEGSENEDSSEWEDMYAVKIRSNWYVIEFEDDWVDFSYEAW